MDAHQPITRAEFLKRTLSIVAVFAVGGILSQATGASRLFRSSSPAAYGNSTYGGRA
ncbi:hypothetical protein [Rhodoplanes sp. SY1]|uniref:hypothetical protein n=1 Tax=Rhodoplanes sp. SY1 TaxID=3166646 RepID=UPI0038B4DF7A